MDEPLLQLWMAELLYPNELSETLREQFKATYQEIYHYAISDDDIDKAVFLKENISSAGYERFVR